MARDQRLKIRRKWATIGFWMIVATPPICIFIAFLAPTEVVERLKIMEFMIGASIAALVVIVHKYYSESTKYDGVE